jgi:choline kinase
MKNYKVCILAAGLGSRSFNPDINKALLPLNNKAINTEKLFMSYWRIKLKHLA